ncbi:uncharacterized protein Triagg1_570 [Trichoderma aggressivum f. europaeum]|uniref:Xylanolytic transcriptional activator regulatory domain-containing protein n=1 Tax=Trichoderma aggressivum f. europaeum TaxID=173218 RepID=A0AAE1JJ52_9HYPO|nr:hypothetical protein Triagg1_570 [Trichoderma aggressivum f. europaeum]
MEQTNPNSVHKRKRSRAARLPSFQNDRVPAAATVLETAGESQTLMSTKLDLLIDRVTALEKALLAQRVQCEAREVTSTPPKQPLPIFQGSTSSVFSIVVADTNLKVLEPDATGPPISDDSDSPRAQTTFSIVHGQIINELSKEAADGGSESRPIVLPRAAGTRPQPTETQTHIDLSCNDLISLVYIYQNLAGTLYPFLNFPSLVQQARLTWAARLTELTPSNDGVDVGSKDVAILKIVAAIALLAEGEGRNDLALSLYHSILPEVEAIVWSTKLDLKGLMLLPLVSLFYIHQSKWRLAWRFLGNVARIVLELGLNRQIVLERSFPDMADRTQAINAIWTTFLLNRLLSYLLGVTVAMQNLHLDPTFPGPVDAPYLEAMIEFDRIGTQAIDVLLSDKSDDCTRISERKEHFAFFQYRLDEWGKRISTDFQFLAHDAATDLQNQQLRTLLHLWKDHLHMIVARSFICDNRCSAAPLDIWASSVGAAADTIQHLSCLECSTRSFRFHQSKYNHFLIAALGTLLLAVSRGSSNPDSMSLGEQRIPMTQTTYLEAQQNAVVALNLLYTLAKTSHHFQFWLEHVRGLARRLKLFDRLVPGSYGTDDSGLQNEALGEQVRSARDATTELIRMAESYVFESVDNVIPPGLQDIDISPLTRAPSLSEPDLIQDFGWLFGGSLVNSL